LGKHRNALRNRCLPKRSIRRGEGETGTRCEVKISGIIRRDILAARQRLQIHIFPEALGLDPDRPTTSGHAEIAVPGLRALSLILLVYSGLSARHTEISYGEQATRWPLDVAPEVQVPD